MALAVMLSASMAAFADDLKVNGLQNDTNSVSFTAGSSATVEYFLSQANKDGLDGCNATTANPASLTITAPTGVTVDYNLSTAAVDSGPLKLEGCGGNDKKSVKFSSTTVGSHNITASVTGGVGGTYNVTAGAFTLNVTAATTNTDTTSPVISAAVTGATGSNGWYVGDVNVDWTVSDPQSAISFQEGCSDFNVDRDQNATTYKCTATSSGGTSSHEISIKRDATKPGISGADFVNSGWTNQEVSKAYTASDNLSGLAEADQSFNITASAESTKDDNGNVVPTKATRTVTDLAGNVSDPRSVSAQIDLTPPTAPNATFDKNPEDTDGGWYKDSVMVSYSGSTDPLSGIASYNPISQILNVAGSNNYSGKAIDNADNQSNATSGSVNVDTQNPELTLKCPSGSVTIGSSSASANWTASDPTPGSGLATADNGSIALNTGSFGAGQTATAPAGTAKDKVGHDSAQASCPYAVSYGFKGFLQPIDGDMVNAGKLGRTYPVKWQLTGSNGALISDAAAEALVGSMSVQQRSVTYPTATSDSLETEVTTSSTSVRYDSASDQFIYNYKAPSSGSCYNLDLIKADGINTKTIQFKFAK